MNFFKDLFNKKGEPITSNQEFWKWFSSHEKEFYNCVKQQKNIEEVFFKKLSDKLNDLKEGYYFLTGMLNDTTAELIITAEGSVRNIVFVEELVEAAPAMTNWKFTALKPALEVKDVSINMSGYKFNRDNLFFIPEELPGYPDEIDIKVIHQDFNNDNAEVITNGVYIFLDNLLGELDFATTVDNLTVGDKGESKAELIPIEKLKDYLIWREKEFIEKYVSTWHNTEDDNYAILEATLPSGNPLVAIINRNLLQWDAKASHPWMLNIIVQYDGSRNQGMPDKPTYQLLNTLEDEILFSLSNEDGYLNIGRQTAEGRREIYFTCKEFRRPAKVMQSLQQKYAQQLPVSYDIFKDKYWQSLNRFA